MFSQGASKHLINSDSFRLKASCSPLFLTRTITCKPTKWGIVSRQGLGSQAPQTQQQQRPLKDLKSRYTASALAFLGDAVWSMHVRRHYLLPPKHSTKYHDAVDKHSAAEMQALYYDRLVGSDATLESSSPGQDQTGIHRVSSAPFALTASEDAIVQWTLSEPFLYRQRFQGREGAQVAYQKATALEALIGYLALTDAARLGQLMATLLSFLPEQ